MFFRVMIVLHFQFIADMVQLRINLLRPDRIKTGEYKEIYRNTLEFNESVTIPYELLVNSLKILYPFTDLIISFTLNSIK